MNDGHQATPRVVKTVMGVPAEVIARSGDWEVVGVKKPWWERTYSIPRWLVWMQVPTIIFGAIRGVHLIVVWLS